MVTFICLLSISVFVFQLTCMSIVFTKADKPSWGCIVPIYGVILLCDIAGRPRWWTVLCLIPLVNLAAYAVLSIGISRNFDKSDSFGVGLALLPAVFYAILAFGDSDWDTYDRPERTAPAGPVSPPLLANQPNQKAASPASPVTGRPRSVTPASDSMGQRPWLARCPTCRSTTFHVVEEAGTRRCSNCHTMLPSYVQGNDQAAGQSPSTQPVQPRHPTSVL